MRAGWLQAGAVLARANRAVRNKPVAQALTTLQQCPVGRLGPTAVHSAQRRALFTVSYVLMTCLQSPAHSSVRPPGRLPATESATICCTSGVDVVAFSNPRRRMLHLHRLEQAQPHSDSKEDEISPAALTKEQKKILFVSAAVPMIGFGFMDNLVMITMGELSVHLHFFGPKFFSLRLLQCVYIEYIQCMHMDQDMCLDPRN